jgi:amino acid adenylation domain-containing protein
VSDLNQRVAALSPAKRALLERRSREPKPPAPVPAPQRVAISRRSPQQGAIPLSFAQERIWFLDRLEPGNIVFSIPNMMRFKGNLDVAALERALNEIVRRHEILRSTYTERDGRPFLVVQPFAPFDLPVADLASLPQREREEEAARLCAEEARRPFDLTCDLMLRGSLFRLAGDDHIFFQNRHHIASDGWSYGVLMREVESLYRAFAAGEPSPLPELSIQYADFALWQRDWLQGERIENLLAFWRAQLADVPALLELPTDRPRPPVQSYRGATFGWDFSESLSAALSELARSEGATLFMVLLAAFQALLHRYTGSDQVVVGSVTAGRNRVETESLLGFFVNTLVLRGDLSGDPSFKEFLGRTREVCTAAFAHQDLPFDALVNELHPARDAGHSPLFQVMFVFQKAPTEVSLPGLRVTPSSRIDNGTAQFDLTVSIEERGDALHADIEYSADLFDSSTIRRMLGHYQTLLEAIVEDPDEAISCVPLLTSAERHQLLVEWNSPQAAAADAPLHELFETQAARSPDTVALAGEGQQRLTYAELNAQANRLARRLRGLGVGPDALVGLCMERSNELVIGLLAILKAGGAYLPIDLAYPGERVAFMLEDARAPVLLTQRKLAYALPPTTATVLYADDVLAEPARVGEETDLPPLSGPDHLAYVIYTSGTTGKPKGSLITHRNVARLFSATEHWYGFNDRDVWTLFHSSAFDFSVWEIWGALLYGGRLVVVPYLVSRSPEAFYQLLATEGVTVLNQTPSAFRQLIQAEETMGAKDLALRYVIFGGEALEMQSLRPWFDRHGDDRPRLVNMYGITETTVHVTYRPLSKQDLNSGSVIGHPIPDLRIYILDRHGQPVPIGVPGEMYVGGAGLARGYLNRPDLTRERFIPDPFLPGSEARLYQTGDLARWRADGDIEYLGRVDQQIKIRGYRIELGEIEAVLGGHPEVASCAVAAQETGGKEKSLAAFVVGREGAIPSTQSLRQWLSQKVPDYMIPSRFMAVPELPLNINGKIDRNALLKLDGVELVSGGEYVAPSTISEKIVARIWQEILRRERIGVDELFFDAGGHSLLAVRMLARLEATVGRKVSLATLFAHPTIRALACQLDSARQMDGGDSANALIAIREDGSRPPLFFFYGDVIPGPDFCFELGKQLGENQPVYIVPPVDLPGYPAHPSLRETVKALLESVRSVRPKGPYILGGYCYGGLVAYEAARQLETAGESVDLLILVDSFSPSRPSLRAARRLIENAGPLAGIDADGQRRTFATLWTFVSRCEFWLKRFVLRCEFWLNLSGCDKLTFLRLKFAERLWKFQPRPKLAGENREESNLVADYEAWPDLRDTSLAFQWELAGYSAGSYSGRAILFTSGDTKARHRDRMYGWGNFVARIEVHPIPGNHGGCVTTHRHFLFEKLKACLEAPRA